MQVQLAEAEGGPQGHRLGGDPLAPHRFVTDHETGLAVAVAMVDAVDAGRSDDPAVHFDRPRDAVRVLAGPLKPLFFL